MKSLKESLFDADLVSKDIMYHPRNREELRNIIKEQLDLQGPDANLNIIDVSKIDDMGELFFKLDPHNIDISEWDVSNVTDMYYMFYGCDKFNCDLSKWDVRKVEDMSYTFYGCKSLKKIPSWYHG